MSELIEKKTTNLELVRKNIAPDLTEQEFEFFAAAARRYELDPLRREIYPLKFKGRMSIFVGIDGLRLIAERTGKLDAIGAAEYSSDGIEWKECWSGKSMPVACKVKVYKVGSNYPTVAVCHFEEFNKNTGGVWGTMPLHMLAKCTEANALRKAFPDLRGLYEPSEQWAEAEVVKKPKPTVENAEEIKEELKKISLELKEKYNMEEHWPNELLALRDAWKNLDLAKAKNIKKQIEETEKELNG